MTDHGLGGTGLGLYLCREIVERHHGRIWLTSQEGQGATFSVVFPLHTPQLDETTATPSP